MNIGYHIRNWLGNLFSKKRKPHPLWGWRLHDDNYKLPRGKCPKITDAKYTRWDAPPDRGQEDGE